jgi:hypothetical protein
MQYKENYLAKIRLEKRLAPLPESIFLTEPNIISVVMGSKRCDLSALREPFHREFANSRADGKAVLMFTRQYGLLDWAGQFAGRTDVAGQKFSFDVETWREHQVNFLSAWATASRNPRGLPWEVVPVNFPIPTADSTWQVLSGLREGDDGSLILKGPHTLWKLTEEGPSAYIYAQTTWEYLWMHLCFEKRANLRTCRNPDCGARYFISHRKNQTFCGQDCAHRIAVRRWWNHHGSEWRKSRSKRRKLAK